MEQMIAIDSNRNCDYQTIVDSKIDLATAGLPSFIFKDITQNVSPENALNIVKYVFALNIKNRSEYNRRSKTKTTAA